MTRFTFKQLFQFNVPAGLERAILARIDMQEIIRSKRRITIFATALAASGIVCITAMRMAYIKFITSASPQYLSLLLSDRMQVLVLWKQFAAVVAESLPLFAVTVALTTLLATLYFFKKLLNNIAPHHGALAV